MGSYCLKKGALLRLFTALYYIVRRQIGNGGIFQPTFDEANRFTVKINVLSTFYYCICKTVMLAKTSSIQNFQNRKLAIESARNQIKPAVCLNHSNFFECVLHRDILLVLNYTVSFDRLKRHSCKKLLLRNYRFLYTDQLTLQIGNFDFQYLKPWIKQYKIASKF